MKLSGKPFKARKDTWPSVTSITRSQHVSAMTAHISCSVDKVFVVTADTCRSSHVQRPSHLTTLTLPRYHLCFGYSGVESGEGVALRLRTKVWQN